MTREQAINYLFSRGLTHEQVGDVVRALTYEPTTKDFGELDCISRVKVIDYLCKHCPDDGECFKDCEEIKHLRQMPSVTPQSSVPEVTALAEWTEKLTKASEDAYNKGYADGVKSVNICPHCGEYIGEEE